ncbi:MAG: translation initiation factor eIF-1A [Methanobacteriota archaeon]|nr:MAG: translation initiation factor eIF-1A [Euryarchaeota archaeon]
MGRRREEVVDEELLAKLESGDADSGKIRVKTPNTRINEMFALASQILGGRRIRALCGDGETRLARIPGKMRRWQWVREGDLIIIQPWDFQDAKADVRMRYTKTQALYLSRKGVLPQVVDTFGMGDDTASEDDSGIWEASDKRAEPEPEEAEPESDDDGEA